MIGEPPSARGFSLVFRLVRPDSHSTGNEDEDQGKGKAAKVRARLAKKARKAKKPKRTKV